MNIAQKKVYDVCVIGSGAAGGFMVNELTAAGADTILIEAGSKGRLEDLYIHDWPYDLPKRGFGLNKQASLYGDDIGNAIEYRGDRVGVDRIRTLGGRTFHWNAVCLRFSADDFRERSLHGVEEDWPLSYEEIAPFYSFAERRMHVFGTWRWPHHAKSIDGFGPAYKKRVRELQPAMFQVGAWGKVEHRAENRVTVDPKKVDKFGVPIPIEVLDACGVETVVNRDERPGGFASHEVGTCRMGKNSKTSVVNSYCQSHEIKNLFVVDGSCFTTFSEKNPTLTIAALAVRSARHIAEMRRRGEL
jgi:choline dehydrogenase-like flavoprotein